MCSLAIIFASLVAYLQAWSYNTEHDIDRLRVVCLAFFLMTCLCHLFIEYIRKRCIYSLYEKMSLIVFVLFTGFFSIYIEKLYLFIPLIFGYVFKNLDISYILKRLLIIYTSLYLLTLLLYFTNVLNGAWGFYHINVAASYIVGILAVCFMLIFFQSRRELFIKIYSLVCVISSLFTGSVAGIIVSILLVVPILFELKFKVLNPILVYGFVFLPLIITLLILLIYQYNIFGLGENLNSLLSSRPYIWNETIKSFDIGLFPHEDTLVFADISGNAYTMPIDSIYISIPYSCGLIYSVLVFSSIVYFVHLILKYKDICGEDNNFLIYIVIVMLLYGVVEIHAIEYQVMPVMYIVFYFIFNPKYLYVNKRTYKI